MQNEIYTVHNWQSDAGRAQCRVNYDATHPVFSGHFPGQPVVPGVCTMDMVKELMQEALGKRLVLKQAAQVKFLQLILPEAEPEVQLIWQEQEENYSVNASLKAGDAFVFKMTAHYEVI